MINQTGSAITPQALKYEQAFELGKYEAIEMRTRPKEHFRLEAKAEFDRKFNGQLDHIKQTINRDQVPYQRGYAIGVQKCAQYGLSVAKAMGPTPQVPLDMDIEDNGVVDKMEKRCKANQKKMMDAKRDYRKMHNLDMQVMYDPQRQNKTWIKLVAFYSDASELNSSKVDLNCAKLRAQNYLKDYEAGRPDLTKRYDETWNTGYNGLDSDLVVNHPELEGDSKRIGEIRRAMNPTVYLKSPAYFKTKAILEAKKNGGVSKVGLLKKIKKTLGLLHEPEPEHHISADLEDPVDGLPNVNTKHSDSDKEDGFDL